MSKSTKNTGKSWSRQDEKALKQLANEYTPTRVIGVKLKRTEDAIRGKAEELGVHLGTRKTSKR
jgi:hypothetical protein